MSGPVFNFNTNVPQSTQLIRLTQQPIFNNFQAINELININHIGFNDQDNYGKHNATSLVSQGSSPSTSASEMALFCAPSSGANPYEIYYRYPNNGAVAQLSGSNNADALAEENGFAVLADTSVSSYPVIIKWGVATGLQLNTTVNTITYPTGPSIPAFTGISTVLWTYKRTSAGPSGRPGATTTVSTTGFNWICTTSSGSTVDIYWIAIGL